MIEEGLGYHFDSISGMGSNSKTGKKDVDSSLLEEGIDFERKAGKRPKPLEGKGTPTFSLITEEWKTSSCPPSPIPLLSLDGRTGHKPAEIFRTDLISAMKLPDSQILNTENYMSITDTWRQEWERGVQVPVNPDGLSQPCARLVEAHYKKASFKLPPKFLKADEKKKSRTQCIYDLNRTDVEWLTALNRSRRNKGKTELDEGTLEKAIAYMEDKCYENMGYAIVTQKGLSIEYDESVCCDVCQSPESEEGNEMVFCDSCDICVHQACYGIQSIPSGSWLCQPCRWGVAKPPCKLCSACGGAMKKAKGGKTYIHVSCALWVPEVGFGNVERMEPIIKVEKIPTSRWNLVCYLCKEKVGACIQCSVKSCVTAFHVTCGFQEGLDMRTILDDTEVDGVRHVSYCSKHGYKNKSPGKSPGRPPKSPRKSPNKSPPRSPEKIKQDKEEAENQRQKRLKQMEGEFYNYVDVGEIAKDLALPKELASHIHAYWTLKRKARDDVPLVPPTPQQQEKLSGKQGAADISKNLQVQIERLMKMRCDLERLRNLCYMVGKREKMRRELFRVRERVFWQANEVMTDESITIDDQELSYIRAACRENFSSDGSAPQEDSPWGDVSTRLDSAYNIGSPRNSEDAGSSLGEEDSPGSCLEGDSCDLSGAREEGDSSDSESSGPARRPRSLVGTKRSQRLSTPNQESAKAITAKCDSPQHAVDEDGKPSTPPSRSKKRTRGISGDSVSDNRHTPRRSLRNLSEECSESRSDEAPPRTDASDKVPSPRTKWREQVESCDVPQAPLTRRRTNSKQDADEKAVPLGSSPQRIGLDRPKTRGRGSEGEATSSSEDAATRDDSATNPARSLRRRRQLTYISDSSTGDLKNCSAQGTLDAVLSSPSRTRSARPRRTSMNNDLCGISPAPINILKVDDSESSTGRDTRLVRSARRNNSDTDSVPTKLQRVSESLNSSSSKEYKLHNPSDFEDSPVRETRRTRIRSDDPPYGSPPAKRKPELEPSDRVEVMKESPLDFENSPARETRRTRLRSDDLPSENLGTRRKTESESSESDGVMKENKPQSRPRKRRNGAYLDCGSDNKNPLSSQRRRSSDMRAHRRSRGGKVERRRTLNSKHNEDVGTRHPHITDFLARKVRSPKTAYHCKTSDSEERNESAESDEENELDRVQRLTSLRSFTSGQPESPCPECQIQHHRHPTFLLSANRRSPKGSSPLAKELRMRNSESLRCRGRLSVSLRLSPARVCGNMLARVCGSAMV